MRNKYIRFFISSTFEDLKLERDLLQEVFDELIPIYAEKGWQIETIDLRWGITKEAGLDNKTMQICLAELKRCQELSPKPNFIILMGDRYGWIPLPENIPLTDIDSWQLNKHEKDLFFTWYRLDENAIPSQYVLQKRAGCFEDNKIWQHEVEAPLGKLFQKHNLELYGISATEQEIQEGALKVRDAQEHVIAYIRHLVDVPDDLLNVYYEKNNKDKLESLYARVKETVSMENLVEFEKLYYSLYNHEKFRKLFKSKMLVKISSIINRYVEEDNNRTFDQLSSEKLYNETFVNQETSHFVGRHDVMHDIDSYIKDLNTRKALWIKGNSGTGKSALLAKVVEKYKNSHNVICRFCGQTETTNNITNFFSLLWREMNEQDKSRQYSTPSPYPTYIWFSGKLEHYIADKPLLVIIDAIDQIEDEHDIIAAMRWIPQKGLGKNVKLIFSSVEELRFSIKRNNIIQYVMPNMGNDAWLLISSDLFLKRRKLSCIQIEQIKNIIEKSDKSAIYLRVLSQYLSTIPSWHNLCEIPTNLQDIVKYIITKIVESGHFNKSFVTAVLRLMASERIGFRATEIMEIVANDEGVYSSISNDSFHHIESRKIPIAMWSRLHFVLSPFLRNAYTSVGQVFKIFHQSIKNEISRIFLPTDYDKALVADRLYQYYRGKYSEGEIHANSEMIYQGYIAAYYYSHVSKSESDNVKLSIYEILNDGIYLTQKSLKFPLQFNNEIDMISKLYPENIKKWLNEVKIEIAEVKNNCSNEVACHYYMKSMPASSILRKIADRNFNLPSMKNAFSEMSDGSEVLHVVNEWGDCPIMSEDGDIIAYLTQNRHEIKINYLMNNTTTSYPFQDEIEVMDFDYTFRYNTICTKTFLICYDNAEKKTIVNIEREKFLWFSASKQKRLLVVGTNDDIRVYNFDGSYDSWDFHAISGKLSPSGDYLWFIDDDYSIIRLDCNNGEFIRCHGKINREKDNPPHIQNCTDEWVAYSGNNVLHAGQNKYYNYFFPSIKKIYFNSNHLLLVGSGLCRMIDICKDGDDIQLKIVRMTHVENLIYVNSSMTYALIGDNERSFFRIVDFRHEMSLYTPLSGGNTGINNLATDYLGNNILLSAGINHSDGGVPDDINQSVLRIENQEKYEWYPPFNNKDYRYVSTTAISPNGLHIAAASVNENSEMILIDSVKGNVLRNIITDNTRWFVAMAFSSDGKFLVAHTGNYFNDKYNPIIHLLDIHGNILLQVEAESSSWSNKNHICISPNNRYIFSAEEYASVGIFDINKGKFLFRDKKFYFYACKYHDGFLEQREKGFVVYLSHCDSVLANNEEGRLAILHLNTEEYDFTDIYENPIASSPSGRLIYFIKDGILSMRPWPLSSQKNIIMENVRWATPALDDNHIFIFLNNGFICLYNSDKRIVEQKAYYGWGCFQQVCSKGIAVAYDGEGKIALFQPDAKFGVNRPAIVSFVRHINHSELAKKTVVNEKKSLIERNKPTAICPICGKEIMLSSKLKNILKKPVYSYPIDDWNNPLLSNHSCPHCNSELRIAPYIV